MYLLYPFNVYIFNVVIEIKLYSIIFYSIIFLSILTMPRITYNIFFLKIVPFSAMVNHVDRSYNEGRGLTAKRFGELYNCFSTCFFVMMCKTW